MNDERSPQAIRVLTLSVRMIPVGAYLVDLMKLSAPLLDERDIQLTGNE